MTTRAEYLTSRGWTSHGGKGQWWRDPQVTRDAQSDSDCCSFDAFMVTTADAVTIQRARDAVEERAAWVAFAAARLTPVHRWERDGGSNTEVLFTAPQAAEEADALLVAYRARFAAPATFTE